MIAPPPPRPMKHLCVVRRAERWSMRCSLSHPTRERRPTRARWPRAISTGSHVGWRLATQLTRTIAPPTPPSHVMHGTGSTSVSLRRRRLGLSRCLLVRLSDVAKVRDRTFWSSSNKKNAATGVRCAPVRRLTKGARRLICIEGVASRLQNVRERSVLAHLNTRERSFLVGIGDAAFFFFRTLSRAEPCVTLRKTESATTQPAEHECRKCASSRLGRRANRFRGASSYRDVRPPRRFRAFVRIDRCQTHIDHEIGI